MLASVKPILWDVVRWCANRVGGPLLQRFQEVLEGVEQGEHHAAHVADVVSEGEVRRASGQHEQDRYPPEQHEDLSLKNSSATATTSSNTTFLPAAPSALARDRNLPFWKLTSTQSLVDDFLFGFKCAPTLLAMGLFPSTKEISESMGAYHAYRKFFRDWLPKNCAIVVVGDGVCPRTAGLFAFGCAERRSRKYYSVDPILRVVEKNAWSGEQHHVSGVAGGRGEEQEEEHYVDGGSTISLDVAGVVAQQDERTGGGAPTPSSGPRGSRVDHKHHGGKKSKSSKSGSTSKIASQKPPTDWESQIENLVCLPESVYDVRIDEAYALVVCVHAHVDLTQAVAEGFSERTKVLGAISLPCCAGYPQQLPEGQFSPPLEYIDRGVLSEKHRVRVWFAKETSQKDLRNYATPQEYLVGKYGSKRDFAWTSEERFHIGARELGLWRQLEGRTTTSDDHAGIRAHVAENAGGGGGGEKEEFGTRSVPGVLPQDEERELVQNGSLRERRKAGGSKTTRVRRKQRRGSATVNMKLAEGW